MYLNVTFPDGTKTLVSIWPELYAETLEALLKAGAVKVEARCP